MQIKTRKNKGRLIFAFEGELDEHSAGYARDLMDTEIDGMGGGEIILDFKGLRFMDSTGIGVILGRYKRLSLLNIPVFIANPSPQVDKLLTTGGLYRIIKKIS